MKFSIIAFYVLPVSSLPSLDDPIQPSFVDVVVFSPLHQRAGFEEVVGGDSQFARHVIDVDGFRGRQPIHQLTSKFAETEHLQAAGFFRERVQSV